MKRNFLLLLFMAVTANNAWADVRGERLLLSELKDGDTIMIEAASTTKNYGHYIGLDASGSLLSLDKANPIENCIWIVEEYLGDMGNLDLESGATYYLRNPRTNKYISGTSTRPSVTPYKTNATPIKFCPPNNPKEWTVDDYSSKGWDNNSVGLCGFDINPDAGSGRKWWYRNSGENSLYGHNDTYVFSDLQWNLHCVNDEEVEILQEDTTIIDNQSPGWLSNNIPFVEQQNVEYMKVMGYINGDDLQFIAQLNANHRLIAIDLENVNIVAGGNGTLKTEANELRFSKSKGLYFSRPLRKLVLPKSLTRIVSGDDNVGDNVGVYVDTLVFNGSYTSLNFKGLVTSDNARCIYIPEGVNTVDLYSYGYFYISTESSYTTGYNLRYNYELFLPSTIKLVQCTYSGFNNPTFVIHCPSITPTEIQAHGKKNIFARGTIYVPRDTKQQYEQSDFRDMIIIEEVPTDSIKFTEKELYIYIDSTKQCPAMVFPENALDKSVTYKVVNKDICSISAQGEVKASSAGETKIYAYSQDKQFIDSCIVRVYAHATGVNIQPTARVAIAERIKLTATTLPEGFSDGKLTWETSDKDIATIDAFGVVKGVSRGTCTIIATSVDGGYSAECTVTVVQPVEGIMLDKHTCTLKIDNSDKLYAQITPASADNKKIIWNSSNLQTVSVDDKGNVVGVASGTAYIYAIADDNIAIADSCLVTVTQPVTGVMIDIPALNFENVGESATINAIVTPDNASNKEVRWTSTNPGVCVVSNGNVIAVGDGTSVVIATTVDGSFIATCAVTVDTTTGIAEMAKENKDYIVYNIQGQKIDRLNKGINIIRFPDGVTKKVVVK